MHARPLLYVAVGMSVVSVVACALFVPLLYARIGQVQQSVALGMVDFRAARHNIWTQLYAPTVGVRVQRQAKSTAKAFSTAAPSGGAASSTAPGSQCDCDVERKCPAGPKGEDGEPGKDGEQGAPGYPGLPGLKGNMPSVMVSITGCRLCPRGLDGPAGRPGQTGKPGSTGPDGFRGAPGDKGLKGYPGGPGEPGKIGEAGKIGEVGPQGANGTEGKKGAPGPKGEPGQNGEKGHKGDQGPDAKQGGLGRPGDAGPPGTLGNPGQPGPKGPDGPRVSSCATCTQRVQGPPGVDAQYCPCPARGSLTRPAKGPAPPQIRESKPDAPVQATTDSVLHILNLSTEKPLNTTDIGHNVTERSPPSAYAPAPAYRN